MAAPASLTTITKNSRPRLIQAGTIHKGGAKGTSNRRGWQGGDELPFFRFELEPRWFNTVWNDGSGRTVAAVIQEGLEKLPGWPEVKSLRVRFPFSQLEDNRFWRNDAWATAGNNQFCTYRCDGEKMLIETIDGPKGKPVAVKNPKLPNGQPKPCAAIQGYDDDGQPIMSEKCPNGCTSKWTTSFILPDTGIEMAWTLTTTAVTDFYNFQGTLAQFDGSLNSDGLIFTFTRYEDFISNSDGGAKTRCWPIRCELDPAAASQFWRQKERQNLRALESIGEGFSEPNDFAMLGDEMETAGAVGEVIEVTRPEKRGAEVSGLRKAAKPPITTAAVQNWIEERTSGSDYDQVYSHPSRLSDSDYLSLLDWLRG